MILKDMKNSNKPISRKKLEKDIHCGKWHRINNKSMAKLYLYQKFPDSSYKTNVSLMLEHKKLIRLI